MWVYSGAFIQSLFLLVDFYFKHIFNRPSWLVYSSMWFQTAVCVSSYQRWRRTCVSNFCGVVWQPQRNIFTPPDGELTRRQLLWQRRRLILLPRSAMIHDDTIIIAAQRGRTQTRHPPKPASVWMSAAAAATVPGGALSGRGRLRRRVRARGRHLAELKPVKTNQTANKDGFINTRYITLSPRGLIVSWCESLTAALMPSLTHM